MPLNDACIRLRVLSLSALATAIAGGAAALVWFPNAVLHVMGHSPHIAAALFATAGAFVLTVWLIDRLYFDRSARPLAALFYTLQVMIATVLAGWSFRYDPPAPPVQSTPLTAPMSVRSAEADELRGFQGD